VALAFAGFLASSPFVAVHPGQAWEDFSRVSRLARTGWLGFEHDHWAGIAFVARLWHGLGPVLIIALAGLVAALVRRRRADLVLAVFVLVYFLDLLTLHAHFDRYVLPLVPPLAVLAARFRALAPVTLLLLVVPLAFSVRDDSRLARTDTRVVAARWLAGHASPGAAIAADPSTPTLSGRRIVALQLPGPGRPHDPRRDVAELRRLGVRYVFVTGAVTDRVLRAADRYPSEAAFYRSLSKRARVAFALPADGRFSGPWVRIYDLGA
jgi:hypothetical protein